MNYLIKNALGGLAVGIYAGVAGLVVARKQKRKTKGFYYLLWCSIAGVVLGAIGAIPALAYCLYDLIKDISATGGSRADERAPT
jgi:hypothetical protein